MGQTVNDNINRKIEIQEEIYLLNYFLVNETDKCDYIKRLSFYILIFIYFVAGHSSTEAIYHSLMSCFSDKTMEMVVNLGLDMEEDKNYESLIAGLESVLVTNDKNVHIARYTFQSRVQLPDENFDTWLADLKNLAKLADFNCDNCMTSRLLQQVVAGVYKPTTRQMLFDIGPGLTLNRAARVIRATEFGQMRPNPIQVESDVLSNTPYIDGSIAEMYISITDQVDSNETEPALQDEQPDSTTVSSKFESEKAKSSLNASKNPTEARKAISSADKPEYQPEISNAESESPPDLVDQNVDETKPLKNIISGEMRKHGKRQRQKSITDDSSKKAKTLQATNSDDFGRPETTENQNGDELSTLVLTFDVKSEFKNQGNKNNDFLLFF